MPRRAGCVGWISSVALFAGVGAVQTLCFDRQPSLWLAWVAWMPLVWLALDCHWSLPRRLVAGWVCGSVFWAIDVVWIEHTMTQYGGMPQYLAWVLLGLLALYMGLYWAAFVGLGEWVRRRRLPLLTRVTTLAAAWVLLEIVREWMFTGFPWSPLGESLVRQPGALDAAAWIGVRGLSFLVLLTNASLALYVGRELSHLRGGSSAGARLVEARWLMAATLVLVAGTLTASWWQGGANQKSVAASRPLGLAPLPVRIVQPNVPIGATAVEVVRNYQRLLQLSVCDAESELIVWPESAAFPYMWNSHPKLERDVTRVLDDRCSLLLNTSLVVDTEDGESGFSNTALLATPSAEAGAPRVAKRARTADGTGLESKVGDLQTQRYDKIHLVPYGEYVPLENLLPFVAQLARSVGEFQPGGAINLLRWRQAVLGVAICFEVLFPKEVAERVRMGATVLVTLTNDAWFGDTVAPFQHLVSARFRAAENRRPLLFAAVTGVSAAIDNRGRVIERLPLDEAGTLRIDLAEDLGHSVAAQVTPYASGPWRIDLGALLLFVLPMAFSYRHR